jgi:cytochrome c biogenesis protein CcmG/thiol:disulfide interchange protein DsbE
LEKSAPLEPDEENDLMDEKKPMDPVEPMSGEEQQHQLIWWNRLRRRAIVATSILVVLAALLALLGWGLANREPVTGRSGITRIDKPVPEFVLTTFDGREVDIAVSAGRPMVINFWASWCLPCRREAGTLEAAWQAYGGTDVLFIGVDTDDIEADARAFVTAFGVTYPNGLDPDGEITVDYGVIGLPVTYFVSREGLIVRRWVGEIGPEQLALWVDDLVADRAPEEALGENPDAFFEIGEPTGE